MSSRDLALEGKLAAVRLAVSQLPKRLRPIATCVSMQEAAATLGMTVANLKLTLRGKRMRTTRVAGARLVPLSVVELLRR